MTCDSESWNGVNVREILTLPAECVRSTKNARVSREVRQTRQVWYKSDRVKVTPNTVKFQKFDRQNDGRGQFDSLAELRRHNVSC